MRYTVSYARTHLSQLIRAAEEGEEVIVTRRDTPIVKIIPINLPKTEGQSTANLPVSPER